MRGDDNQQEGMFSYVSPDKRVPADHPLRAIRKMVDEILKVNVAEVREAAHVAQNDTNRRSAVDQRTTRHTGYEISQRKRKRVEQSFGWMKMVGMLKKVKLRGI